MSDSESDTGSDSSGTGEDAASSLSGTSDSGSDSAGESDSESHVVKNVPSKLPEMGGDMYSLGLIGVPQRRQLHRARIQGVVTRLYDQARQKEEHRKELQRFNQKMEQRGIISE